MRRDTVEGGSPRSIAACAKLPLSTFQLHKFSHDWGRGGLVEPPEPGPQAVRERQGLRIRAGAPAIKSAAGACDDADARSSRDQLSTREGGHRSSLLASRRPDDEQIGPVADAEAVDQRGRLLIAGYAVQRLSASLSPRDRRESGRAVPRGAHRARSALSASTRESTVATRAARETLGLLGETAKPPRIAPWRLLLNETASR